MTKAEKKEAHAKGKEEKGEKKPTTFLLHEPDGETYDVRKPIVVEEAEEEKEELTAEKQAAEEAAAEHADFMKDGSSSRPLPREETLVADDVVAGAKRKARDEDANPFAKLKNPKLGEDGQASAAVLGSEDVFVPVTERWEEAIIADNVVAGTKRKAEDDESPATLKKPKLGEEG
jgi:hypothetical protein